MSKRLLRFTSLNPQSPAKRDADQRTLDFNEINEPFGPDAAEDQASRCSQCGVPFCQHGCPLDNNIPDWLRLFAQGDERDAYEASAATNPMPEVCGRVCPQDRLCEQACVIEQSGHGAVTIGAVERHLTDTAWKEGWVEPIATGPDTGLSVGIIGAGPAGLAAAERLRNYGHAVTVYDRHDRAGGLLIYGIPNFKLDKSIVQRRSQRLEDAGVVFSLGVDVGRDVTLAALRDRHDGVLIATGVYHARALAAPGEDAPGVAPALDFLTAANRAGLGDAPCPDAPVATDKNVVVIGGGDTAMDCVRTAVRQGAKSVTCLYRRDRASMPGSAREVASAEEEGVTFAWLSAPAEINTGGDQGVATQVTATRMRLGAPDSSGRRRPEAVPGEISTLPADLVIPALGYDAENLQKLFDAETLTLTRWGTLDVMPLAPASKLEAGSGHTSLEGVFAAGDCVRGASLVVWALRDGLSVADQMNAWMRASGVRAEAAE